MKKLILVFALAFSFMPIIYSGEFEGYSVSATRELIISPSSNEKACFTHLSGSGASFAAAGYTLVLEEGLTVGNTIYAVTVTTSPIVANFQYANPLCTKAAGNGVYMSLIGAPVVKKNWVGYTK